MVSEISMTNILILDKLYLIPVPIFYLPVYVSSFAVVFNCSTLTILIITVLLILYIITLWVSFLFIGDDLPNRGSSMELNRNELFHSIIQLLFHEHLLSFFFYFLMFSRSCIFNVTQYILFVNIPPYFEKYLEINTNIL